MKLHVKSNATKIPRESTQSAILRVALSWPSRKPTVFVRLARWQYDYDGGKSIEWIFLYQVVGLTRLKGKEPTTTHTRCPMGKGLEPRSQRWEASAFTNATPCSPHLKYFQSETFFFLKHSLEVSVQNISSFFKNPLFTLPFQDFSVK